MEYFFISFYMPVLKAEGLGPAVRKGRVGLPRGKVVNKEIQKRSKSCCYSSETMRNCFFLED